MSHVTHINESCHTYKRVMSHIWMSHVTRMNESCHMLHIWASICRELEGVMSHIWMSHVTHMNESCHTYEWVMSHASHMGEYLSRVGRCVRVCVCVCYASRVTACMWTWLVHMCDVPSSYLWCDSFICVTWLVYMCDMTRLYVWHDSFIGW